MKFVTNPNQRFLKNVDVPCPKINYKVTDKDLVCRVSEEFNGDARFRAWLYFYLYAYIPEDGTPFTIQPSVIAKKMGGQDSTYSKAITGLVKAGYIEYDEGSFYTFHAESKKSELPESLSEEPLSEDLDDFELFGISPSPERDSEIQLPMIELDGKLIPDIITMRNQYKDTTGSTREAYKNYLTSHGYNLT